MSVDLTTWTDDGAGSWTTTATTANPGDTTTPAILAGSASAQGSKMTADVRVNTASDDDFFGFVVGYQIGDLTAATSDFYLIDWEQGAQSGAPAGLLLIHVTGPYSGGTANSNFRDKDSSPAGVTMAQAAGSPYDAGWADQTTYQFEITFTSSLINVKVDGNEVFNLAGSFADGGFGLYEFSQPGVQFSNIDISPIGAQVPLPAGGLLLLSGLGAAAAIRRRALA